MTADSPPWLGCLREDLDLARPVRQWLPELLTVRAISTVLFRVSQACGAHVPLLAYVVKQLNHLLTGADLAGQATVGPGLRLYHPTGVVLGPDVVVAAAVSCSRGSPWVLCASADRWQTVGWTRPPSVTTSRSGPAPVSWDRFMSVTGWSSGPMPWCSPMSPAGHLAVGVPARVTPRRADR